jgi:hypothetical protein
LLKCIILKLKAAIFKNIHAAAIRTGPKSPEIRPLSKPGPPGLDNRARRTTGANDGKV